MLKLLCKVHTWVIKIIISIRIPNKEKSKYEILRDETW